MDRAYIESGELTRPSAEVVNAVLCFRSQIKLCDTIARNRLRLLNLRGVIYLNQDEDLFGFRRCLLDMLRCFLFI